MDQETELLKARVNDAVKLCSAKDIPKFIGFLSAEETALLGKTVQSYRCNFRFFAGHENGDRTVLGVFPDWSEGEDELFPIDSLCFRYRECEKLSHRDFLGALMALGITRRSVGDILICDGLAVVYVLSDISKFILSGIEKVGNIGVKVSVLENDELPIFHQSTVQMSTTISSSRLDLVVGACIGGGRNKAEQLISDGLISVNSVVTEKVSKKVSENDVLSIRGFGKFVIKEISSLTKKGRIILIFEKYI